MIRAFLVVLFCVASAALALKSAAAETAKLRLTMPLRCDADDDCAVIKLPDHAPGPEIRDYGCGTMSGGENDYPATSIAIRDMKRMTEGVPVFAAADGRVSRIRDGVADTGVYGPESRAELSAKGCGNMVLLNHGHGWTTAYCHMRNASLTVRPGDAVKAGDKIGAVGLSGLTELPHLHFQVRLHDKPVDPFTGPDPKPGVCGVQPGRLWTDAALATLGTYAPVVVRAVGFSNGEANLRAAREGNYPTALPACPTGGLRLWAEIVGLKKGDQLSLRIDGPDGSLLTVQRLTLDRDFAQAFPQTGPTAVKSAGKYVGLVELWRGGKVFSRRAVLTAQAGC